jgi:hypothetical protein
MGAAAAVSDRRPGRPGAAQAGAAQAGAIMFKDLASSWIAHGGCPRNAPNVTQLALRGRPVTQVRPLQGR